MKFLKRTGPSNTLTLHLSYRPCPQAAGQQIIKSPSPSPSTSSDPEEEPAEGPSSALSERIEKAEPVELEAVAAASNDEDGPEVADPADIEPGRESEDEPEAETEAWSRNQLTVPRLWTCSRGLNCDFALVRDISRR